ncbi:hypothetical protein IW261DRAFT_1435576 [Armillaria novae-zelandiae]|uniref:Uncharacterized protein n=1 Tax=Armillaria novae-zelandiae TaxID=153914 RepID=A0AA39PV16_9AGAR|nr:hypothetical protein IW261DRAFT_1435576 [Armillaria novae-zelandiae]
MNAQDQQQHAQPPNLSRVDSGPPASGPPSAPTAPALSSQAEFRNKVIEIIAGTANGCLSELGYYPTLLADMQKVQAQNQFMTNVLKEREAIMSKWQQENHKLWEDNRRLISLNTDIQSKAAEIDTLKAEIMGKDMTIKELTRQVRGVPMREPDDFQNLLREHQALLEDLRVILNDKMNLEHTIAQMNSTGFGANNQQSVAGPSAVARRNSAPIAQPSQPIFMSRRATFPRPQLIAQQPARPQAAQISPFPRLHVQNPGLAAGWTANQQPQPMQRVSQAIYVPSSIPSQSPSPPLQLSTHSLPSSVGPFQMPPTPPMSAFPAQLSLSTPSSAMNILVQGNPYPQTSPTSLMQPSSSSQSQAPQAQSQTASSMQVLILPERHPPQTQIQSRIVPPTPPVSHKSMSPEAFSETKPIIDTAGNMAPNSGTGTESNNPTLRRSAGDEPPEPSKRAKLEQTEDPPLTTSVEVPTSHDDDEVVEVDATGLRHISVVVEEMVIPDEADPNIKHCFFCRARYDKGALKELPKPFVNNPEEMEKHMFDAHPIALDSLRKQIFDE